ncbi:MAG: hypothetical protein ABIU05_25760 [Nitrospirales bacterium]
MLQKINYFAAVSLREMSQAEPAGQQDRQVKGEAWCDVRFPLGIVTQSRSASRAANHYGDLCGTA